MADATTKGEWVLPPIAAGSAPGPERRPLGGKTRTWTWTRGVLLACVVALGVLYAAGYDSRRVYAWSKGAVIGLIQDGYRGLEETAPVIEMTRQSCTLPPRLAPKKH